ncbi:Murein DD-endopeptidase MepM and murein hydrolase activator NlpD, contain LysM domain [Sulfitobacter marinus]|uniref:Murein DD-endopeptidase MepM and murein hydrolase activator NlpD, contain LysM domain n=1 Tax=Sulfitobacter marinus TaxID=394264 RepID=A0A1I6SBE0_9RHOB|nr:LysM peptidoglycan-binding domain-containing protein [Sulfitobacter marinus]SFS74262.1 Murein DD-endopeptidase MepM and murein hydrolase activator NlpD, contain LysM domain [Sulfitobacter marinus]
MIHPMATRTLRLTVLAGSSALLLAACERPLDFDLRGGFGDGFTTADAATGPLAVRPMPDNRGVISYPNYQVVVARQGDTLNDVASRVGTDADALSRYNGIDPNVRLRKGEIIALETRVAEPSPATGASGTGPITTQAVDIQTLAGSAINRVPESSSVQTAALPAAQTSENPLKQTGREPVRHRVERGETAYTIARLYAVPVETLAEWNGLGADFSIREGQFLLIPVPQQAAPTRETPVATATATPVTTTLPGAGSPTPTPPSAAKPLPPAEPPAPKPAATQPAPAEPVADVGKTTKPTTAGRMTPPVQGSIIRAYSKGKNEGINIKAAPGTTVKAADSGTVAAITKSAEGIPIVVVRHPDNLLTVYANVTDVSVAKGDSVSKGAPIAKLRSGEDAFVHFEVRNGFDSVDPSPYLN